MPRYCKLCSLPIAPGEPLGYVVEDGKEIFCHNLCVGNLQSRQRVRKRVVNISFQSTEDLIRKLHLKGYT